MCGFLNDEEKVVEWFVGLKHLERCTFVALKEALVGMLSSHNLSIYMLRGQGYDGASNMRGSMCIILPLVAISGCHCFNFYSSHSEFL